MEITNNQILFILLSGPSWPIKKCSCGSHLSIRSSTTAPKSIPATITQAPIPGHISLPNGQGLEYRSADGSVVRAGVAPNELTDVAMRDFLAGTPWHKHVPARLERCDVSQARSA